MKVTFLGTGTSQGVPVICCKCSVCNSNNPKDKRLRSSIYIEIDNKHIVIDSGPDFRQQMLSNNVTHLDAIVYTHEHKDHTAGLDDVRAYNYHQQEDIPIYATEKVLEQIKMEFAYIFNEHKYPGIPQIETNVINEKTFDIKGVKITPIEVQHFKLPVFGYRINNFCYITDANFISQSSMDKLKNLDVLILNALRKEKHLSHFNLLEAIEIIEKLKPKKAYLTHISHYLGLHDVESVNLPKNIHLAYDGLTIEING